MKYLNPVMLCCSLVIAAPLSAQNFPFPTADAEWVTTHVSNYCIGGSNIYYLWREYLGADTVLQGKTYQRLLFQPECEHVTTGQHCTGFDRYYAGGPITVGGVRTEGQKVYFHKFNLADSLFGLYETALRKIPAEQDVLLYDFNWAVGDTVVVQVKDGNHLYLRVAETGVANGRKNIVATPLTGTGYQIGIVEGAGAGSGLFGLYYSPAASYYLPLGTCFYHNGGQVLKADYCGVCGLVDAPERAEELAVRVYPNPATEVLHLEAGRADGPYRLRAYDLQGRLLYADAAFPGDADLPLSRLQTRGGWVLLSLQTAGGAKRWTGRVWVAP